MNSLWKAKDTELFHKPVTPVELRIPDYFNIIKNQWIFQILKNNYVILFIQILKN